MMADFTNIPDADDSILSHPYVKWQSEQLLKLMSEVASLKSLLSTTQADLRRLKNLPKKPELTASKLDSDPKVKQGEGKRPGSAKQKKRELSY